MLTPGKLPIDYGAKHHLSLGRKNCAFQLRRGLYANPSRNKIKEKQLWQRRFWEHLIRDDADFSRHCDYIHYNPVKHGLCDAPEEWPYSSFHRFVAQGIYEKGWGSSVVIPNLPESVTILDLWSKKLLR